MGAAGMLLAHLEDLLLTFCSGRKAAIRPEVFATQFLVCFGVRFHGFFLLFTFKIITEHGRRKAGSFTAAKQEARMAPHQIKNPTFSKAG
jgi:hypothetical protein